MSETEKDARIYELGYWFVPTIAEDAVDAQVTELKNTLTSKDVVFISEEAPYLREISYEMKKVINNQNNYFNEGYFGWIKFEMDPSLAETLRKEMELDPNIIRSMIVQTVRENTVSTKRPVAHKREEGSADTSDKVIEENVEEAAPEVAKDSAPEVETAEAKPDRTPVSVEETAVIEEKE